MVFDREPQNLSTTMYRTIEKHHTVRCLVAKKPFAHLAILL